MPDRVLGWQGIIFAPNGGIDFTGTDNSSLTGSLIGLGVKVGGARFRLIGIDLNSCQPAPVLLTAASAGKLKSASLLSSFPRPALQFALDSGGLLLSFATDPTHHYFVEASDLILPAKWEVVHSTAGDGTLKQQRVATVGSSRFYRLRLQSTNDPAGP